MLSAFPILPSSIQSADSFFPRWAFTSWRSTLVSFVLPEAIFQLSAISSFSPVAVSSGPSVVKSFSALSFNLRPSAFICGPNFLFLILLASLAPLRLTLFCLFPGPFVVASYAHLDNPPSISV